MYVPNVCNVLYYVNVGGILISNTLIDLNDMTSSHVKISF